MIRKVISYKLCVMGLIAFLTYNSSLITHHFCYAQEPDLEFTLDVTSNIIPLPKIFKPNIDLSGRGFHRQQNWPQVLAGGEVINTWQKDIGFSGLYRIQYNLWEISQLNKDKASQDNLLRNYDIIIKNITEAGGIVILDIFGMPAGLGKVLDKKSPPWNLKAFKELIKSHIRTLSCDKRYNIWYEVWSAPDLDDFFLGRKQEYFNLYRQVAEAIKELELETKIHIPLGGPSVSWWFQNLEGNTIVSPERSLIYELIKFCYRNRLPLDFITWHAYSTDPKVEKETTIYNKSAVNLIRVWLTYFNFDRNIPLLVDEWNYDRISANVLTERHERAFICASYVPARLKNMYEAGVDYQLYFSLEDFQNNKEGVVRNTGIFWYDSESSEYKGGPKAIYNVFRMLASLEKDMFLVKLDDEFVGAIATKKEDKIALLIYNYIAPEIFHNYLSRNISTLNPKERKALVNLIKSDKIGKIMQNQLDVSTMQLNNKVKVLLSKAKALNERAIKFMDSGRNIKIEIKNLNPALSSIKTTDSVESGGVKENYLYQRYTIDSSCSLNCKFSPVEEKEITQSQGESYQEVLTLSPYSLDLLILKKKPQESAPVVETTQSP